jgi:hypothetical protein
MTSLSAIAHRVTAERTTLLKGKIAPRQFHAKHNYITFSLFHDSDITVEVVLLLPNRSGFISFDYAQTYLYPSPSGNFLACPGILLLLVLIEFQPHSSHEKFLNLLTLVAITLSFSSCCSMFGLKGFTAGYRTETTQVKTGKHDIVQEEVHTGGKGGMVKIVEKKVPRYKTATKKVRVPCSKCTRYYCPKKDCCGSTSESTLKMVTAQGSSGSPSIGLMPTMKKLAE